MTSSQRNSSDRIALPFIQGSDKNLVFEVGRRKIPSQKFQVDLFLSLLGTSELSGGFLKVSWVLSLLYYNLLAASSTVCCLNLGGPCAFSGS